MVDYLKGTFKIFRTDKAYVAETSSEDCIFMDITDAHLVSKVLSQCRPDIVLHLAAIKDVGFCELNPDEAKRTNSKGTINILDACAEIGSFLIFLSSDYVFEGTTGMYAEEDMRHPLTVYGKTKKEAEDLVMDSGIECCICRSGGVYGLSKHQSPLLTWAAERFKRGQLINAFVNVYNTPTCVYDLCKGIELIGKERRKGVFHIAGCQRANRRDFLREYAFAHGFDPNLVVEEEYEYRPSKHPFIRPTDLSLSAVFSETELGLRFLSPRERFEIVRGPER